MFSIKNLVVLPLQILLFFWSEVRAQKVDNIRIAYEENIVLIYYDLLPDADSLNADIEVYSSADNFKTPLQYVSGRVGKNIRPSYNNVIIWKAVEEYPDNDFKTLTILIKAKPIIPPYQFTFPAFQICRKGKKYLITWEGGRKSDLVQLFLKGNKVKNTLLVEQPNTGSYLWKVSTKLPKDNYRLSLQTTSEAVDSEPFQITKSRPFWIVVPATLGGLIILYVINNNEKESPLPLPPDPQ